MKNASYLTIWSHFDVYICHFLPLFVKIGFHKHIIATNEMTFPYVIDIIHIHI